MLHGLAGTCSPFPHGWYEHFPIPHTQPNDRSADRFVFVSIDKFCFRNRVYMFFNPFMKSVNAHTATLFIRQYIHSVSATAPENFFSSHIEILLIPNHLHCYFSVTIIPFALLEYFSEIIVRIPLAQEPADFTRVYFGGMQH